ncbi:shikimate 5-dehydrogenase [Sphaerochaeta pleomorpha str. Grapes]|uniref:Shikimate dehydrogenase (NADP(+)) n=1 Tax=Sphaerochaeta pleomorpha (strain ATCC BAA-1885 / DSM 22778 / Grapes) TaxID=158190 RepID=G8QWW9_SPHPG|nr:shikimate dehydrogenase [Sphaerochaeta pleomorpha]AEV29473.1 shikimate 5-dehydrogenase [Sphaerochaeta pleomorpha str. Grapes]
MNEKYLLHALMKGPLPSLFFCIGDPVVGNPTQHMVEQAFQAMGLPYRYITCTVDKKELASAMWGLRSLAFSGGNVTAPHKQVVLEFLDHLSEAAILSHAVNCITRQSDGTYSGDNTDGKGFLSSLERMSGEVAGKKVVILGAGGAASSIATELVLARAGEVTIVNRTSDRAVSLVKRLDNVSPTRLAIEQWLGTYVIPNDADIVVQATSVGLFSPDKCLDVSFEKTKKQLIACDVVFNPVETLFLKRARQRDCLCIDGLGMLVDQGAIAIDMWTGVQANKAVMRKALQEAFAI